MSRSNACASSTSPRRRGLTLVEMMVALAITLLIMATVVTVFASIGQSVSHSRSVIEMADQLRSARDLVQSDLAGVTCQVRPWLRPEAGTGYFEYIEGPLRDANPTMLTWDAAKPVDVSMLGDFDDVLMFTTQSSSVPFVGRAGEVNGAPRIVESLYAEVVWYALEDPESGLRTIYRRVLPIAPWVNLSGAPAGVVYYSTFDVSSRVVNGVRVANTLADLTKRENRFAHGNNFPHSLLPPLQPFTGARHGEDIVLRNVVAFDVRAFDPQAPLRNRGGVVVAPGDIGWPAGSGVAGRGAFVDLNYAPNLDSWFSGFHAAPNVFTLSRGDTYCTWPMHYEYGGPAFDGLDSNNDGEVDSDSERQTRAPYPFPLRAVEVRLRVYEPDSRQVREVAIVQNFFSD